MFVFVWTWPKFWIPLKGKLSEVFNTFLRY